MEISLKTLTLQHKNDYQNSKLGLALSQGRLLLSGEKGEVIPLFLLLTLSCSIFTGSFFWLSKHTEEATRREVKHFQKRWNQLEKKYEDS